MRARLERWREPAGLVTGIPVAILFAAAIVAAADPFGMGERINPEFYAAVAQVIPVLFLGLLLELAVFAGDVRPLSAGLAEGARDPKRLLTRLEDVEASRGQPGELEHEYRELAAEVDEMVEASQRAIRDLPGISVGMQSMSVGLALAAVAGETSALVALAADETSTFLLLTTALSMLAMVFFMLFLFLRRFAVRGMRELDGRRA